MNRARALYKELYDRIDTEEERIPCQEAPDAFFVDENDGNRSYKVALSKKLCASCPLQMLCLEYALEAREQHGIWGGLLPTERETMIRNRRLSA
jgi:WhiB family redox-sensing transcriptional regulator